MKISVRRPWSRIADEDLRLLVQAGQSIQDIAFFLDRSTIDVEERRMILNLADPPPHRFSFKEKPKRNRLRPFR